MLKFWKLSSMVTIIDDRIQCTLQLGPTRSWKDLEASKVIHSNLIAVRRSPPPCPRSRT